MSVHAWYKSGLKTMAITNHFLMDFSYSPQQKPIPGIILTRLATGPRGESTATVVLHGCNAKLTSNDLLLYSELKTSSALTSEELLFAGGDDQQRYPKWSISTGCSPSKAQGSLQKRGQKYCRSQKLWMNTRGQRLPEIAGQLRLWTHGSYDNMQKPQASSCMTKSQHRGGRHVVLPLKLLAADNCYKNDNQFSLRMLPFIGRTYPNGRPHAHEYMDSTNWAQ